VAGGLQFQDLLQREEQVESSACIHRLRYSCALCVSVITARACLFEQPLPASEIRMTLRETLRDDLGDDLEHLFNLIDGFAFEQELSLPQFVGGLIR
jgi:hypothetical protein